MTTHKELAAAFRSLYRDPFGFDWERMEALSRRVELLEAVASAARHPDTIAALREYNGGEPMALEYRIKELDKS